VAKKKIAASTLRAGMRFTKDLCIDGDSLFVAANLPIEHTDLDLLETLGIKVVETEGEEVNEGVPNAAGESGPSASASPPPKPAMARTPPPEDFTKFNTQIKQLDAVFNQVLRGGFARAPVIAGIAQGILAVIRENPQNAVQFILGGRVSGYELATATVDTAIISALISLEMTATEERLFEAIVTALLHVVGMLKLPPALIAKRGPLTPEETQLVQSHVFHSYQIIRQEPAYPERVAIGALQHHENWDGSGYPYALSGDKIDIGAQIIACADSFEAMVSAKPYRDSMLAYEAMKTMLAENSRRFSPEVVKTFVKIMGIYPIGSYVLLSDNRVGQVSMARPDAPLRPVVRVIMGETKGGWLLGGTVDLLAEKKLYVVRACDPRTIA